MSGPAASRQPQPFRAIRRGTPWLIAGLAASLTFFSIFAAAAPQTPRTAEAPVKVELTASPVTGFQMRDPSRRRFGALEFRGGFELTTSYKEFGGISAIRLEPDGVRFLAVSDRGRWLRGRIVYDGERPAGIADAEMAPILGPDGKPLGARRWYDSESLSAAGGTVYVGIERVNQIVRFDLRKGGLLARGQPIAPPDGMRSLVHNKGIECLVLVPKPLPLAGTLIGIAEQSLDGAGNHSGFLIEGASPGAFTVKRSDDFDISDCALLPGGDILILERRYSLLRGVAMRIRRIALASIKPGALVDGPAVIEADMGYQIDNMEGLSIHRTAAGELVLTLISDDNFSSLQRTVLLQFTLLE